MSEKVLVFPVTSFYHPYLGAHRCDWDYIQKILDPKNLIYIDREDAEEDPYFKQVIPYCVLKQSWTGNTFLYRRTNRGGESRLHDLWSVGVGGHINPEDDRDTFEETYEAAFRRELLEEVSLSKFSHRVIGCIYDPSDEVGEVHFGIVHEVSIPAGATTEFHDAALDSGRFVTIQEASRHNLENWSRLVLENLL